MWFFRRKARAATAHQERPRHVQISRTPNIPAAEQRPSLPGLPSLLPKDRQAAPPFVMTREQAQRLSWYIHTYGRTALAAMPATTERDTTLWVMQGVQRKVIEEMNRPASAIIAPPVSLLLTGEERLALKTMTLFLLSWYRRQAESVERSVRLSDLAALKASLQRF